MGDMIMLTGLVISVFFVVRSWKSRKKKSGVCCGNCARCRDGCHRI